MYYIVTITPVLLRSCQLFSVLLRSSPFCSVPFPPSLFTSDRSVVYCCLLLFTSYIFYSKQNYIMQVCVRCIIHACIIGACIIHACIIGCVHFRNIHFRSVLFINLIFLSRLRAILFYLFVKRSFSSFFIFFK